jgi:hypothetical protein
MRCGNDRVDHNVQMAVPLTEYFATMFVRDVNARKTLQYFNRGDFTLELLVPSEYNKVHFPLFKE